MKKLSIFLLSASLFALVACGGSHEGEEAAAESTEATTNEAASAVSEPAAPVATDSAAAMPADTAAK